MDIVSILTDENNILMAFVGVLAFATIVSLARPLMGQSSLEGRLKSVANRREELRRRSREALAQRGGHGHRAAPHRHRDVQDHRRPAAALAAAGGP